MGTVITGATYCLPPTRLTNKDLEERFGVEVMKDVEQLTGVKERRIGGCALQMGYYATKHLMSRCGIDSSKPDILLFVGQTGDYRIPANAHILHSLLGLRGGCAAIDLNLGCSAFPYAVAVVQGLLNSLEKRTAIVVFSDAVSNYIDQLDRSLVVLHGDGAVAMVFETSYRGDIYVELGTVPNSWRDITMPAGGLLSMNEPAAVAHFVIHGMSSHIHRAVENADTHLSDASLVLLHQANKYLVDQVYDRLGCREDQRYPFMSRVGNTAAASSPMVLTEAWRNGAIKAGSTTVVASFGNGMSWGCAVINWPHQIAAAVSGPVEQVILEQLYGRPEL